MPEPGSGSAPLSPPPPRDVFAMVLTCAGACGVHRAVVGKVEQASGRLGTGRSYHSSRFWEVSCDAALDQHGNSGCGGQLVIVLEPVADAGALALALAVTQMTGRGVRA